MNISKAKRGQDMENLEQLKNERIKAYKAGDFARFSAINQKIFEIREQRRKEREQERQEQKDNETDKKIIEILKGV